MKKIVCALCCLGLFFAFSSPVAAQDSYLECLVIGQEADPAKGRMLFRQAMELWHRSRITEAVELYEQAIIADHSILRHEDHGLAMRLMEKYRSKPEPLSVADLCRRGFFENILIGNLEESIRFYEEAARTAADKESAELAEDEARRLQNQLTYIRTWQQGILRENRIRRNQDLQEYLERTERAGLQRNYEDNSFEIEELRERISFLQQQEREAMEEMYSSVRSAGRYRRRYYYPGSMQGGVPDPSNAVPTGNNPGPDASLNTSQVPNPYAGQSGDGISRDTSLNRFYIYRNRAKRQQDQLDQIRAEISGLNRRLAELEKAGRELREKISADPISR